MMIGTNVNSQHIVHLIPRNSVGAEIGVWKGVSSALFVKTQPKKLYLVDPWSVEPYQETKESWERYVGRYSALVGGDNVESFQKYYDKIAEMVTEKYKIYSNVEVRRELSIDFFEMLEETGERLDWIYIDGDHSYEGAYYDFEKALKYVKKGGLIIGDDYGNKPAVKQAVDDWAKEHNKEHKTYGDNQVVVQL